MHKTAETAGDGADESTDTDSASQEGSHGEEDAQYDEEDMMEAGGVDQEYIHEPAAAEDSHCVGEEAELPEESLANQQQVDSIHNGNAASEGINEVEQLVPTSADTDSPPAPVQFAADDFPTLGPASVSTEKASGLPAPAWGQGKPSWASMALKHASMAPAKVTAPALVPASKPRESLRTEADTASFTSVALKASPAVTKEPSTVKNMSRVLSSHHHKGGSSALAAEEDDGEGWISSSNLAVYRANGSSLDTTIRTAGHGGKKGKKTAAAEEAKVIELACITTDFTIQNVLMQLGLHIMSIDGLIIRTVRKFVLRCISCTQIHYDLSRLFCSKCGGSYLTRVGCSIDSNTGYLKLHLKANYQVNLRGTKYNIAKAGSGIDKGKGTGDMLLREDQLLTGIWRQKVKQNNKEIKTNFNLNNTNDNDNIGFTEGLGFQLNKMSGHGAGAGTRNSSIVVGFGHKNPNAMKGRERRGKKKN